MTQELDGRTLFDPGVGTAEWFTALQGHIMEARRYLWHRIQVGGFKDEAEAKATTDAFRSTDKALKLVREGLGQLRLPEAKAGRQSEFKHPSPRRRRRAPKAGE